jgi:hypothetical protein
MCFCLLSEFFFILFNSLVIFSFGSFFLSQVVCFHFFSLSFISDSELNDALFVLLLSFTMLCVVLLLDVFDLCFKVKNLFLQQGLFFHQC